MSPQNPRHISVCICTYQRPQLLRRLLSELGAQDTEGLFTYSIVVADNDQGRSGEAVVADFAASSNIPITYCVESRQNIALARNMAVSKATGDFVAFIDDDEFPTKRWLLSLFEASRAEEVDGVLGPVKRHFDEAPPPWVIKGNFYQRHVYPTGTVLDREEGLTGNALLKRRVFVPGEDPFRPMFRGGSDKDFFRRMIDRGHHFIWCAEAVAYEVVVPSRWKRTFLLKRALFRGALVPLHPNFGPHYIVRSLLALPTYTLALPFALVLGQHRFMNLLVRLFDHVGLVLALLGINPMKQPYITQ